MHIGIDRQGRISHNSSPFLLCRLGAHALLPVLPPRQEGLLSPTGLQMQHAEHCKRLYPA